MSPADLGAVIGSADLQRVAVALASKKRTKQGPRLPRCRGLWCSKRFLPVEGCGGFCSRACCADFYGEDFRA